MKGLYSRFSDETRVFVGHDYAPGGRAFAWQTTIGDLKASNKHIRADTTEEEVYMLVHFFHPLFSAFSLLCSSIDSDARNH